MFNQSALPIVSHQDITPDQLRKWLVLHHADGFGPAKLALLAEHNVHPLELLDSNQKILFAQIKLPDNIQHALAAPDWPSIEKDLSWAEQSNRHIIPVVSSWYPELLREIPDPPILLYAQGDPELLQYPQLAMVGSRNPSHYGQETAFEFARHLSLAGLIITSGMATGIDAHSHQGALAGSGLTIAVAGTGLDSVYPAKNKALAEQIAAQGLLLSEYAIGAKPLAHNFPRRNRIISGLSVGTLVVEAAMQSGSLITARQAMEQGREVFAIPGSIHNPLARGCHHLIRQGAKLVETGDDVLQELAPLIAKMRRGQRSTTLANPHQDNGSPSSRIRKTGAQQNKLLESMDFEPVSIDILVQRSRLTPETISSMLVELELNGLIRSSGGLYSRL
ncbi:MAG: DNA-processing protein DprA [Gammaproteobacteria bacterium]|nr:DNA-processing protein DprA [Gammaproteobacteria bacterium]